MKKINIWILAASVLLLGVTTSCELDEENPSGDTELAWSSIAGYTKKDKRLLFRPCAHHLWSVRGQLPS